MDLSLPGVTGGWRHARNYSSGYGKKAGGTELAFINGARWHTDFVSMLLDLEDADGDSQIDDVAVHLSATSKRVFINGTTPPADYRATLAHDTTNKLYVLTLTDSGEIYRFYDFDASYPENQRGKLKEATDVYGSSVTSFSFTADNNGRINQVTTSQGWQVAYTYINAGTNVGRIEQIDVKNSLGNAIQRAKYTYYVTGAGYSADVGTDADLIMVEVWLAATGQTLSATPTASEVSSHKVTQYRYHADHKLKMVLEAGDVAAITSAGNAAVDTPAEILTQADAYAVITGKSVAQYASRAFTYYSANQDTSSVTTPWTAGENLHSTYGGADLDETGYAKSETVRSGCGGCGGSGGGGVTKTYFYMAIDQGASPAADQVTRIVVEDSEDSDGGATSRTVYGLNKQQMTLRKAVLEDPTAGTLKAWCESTKLGTSGGELNRVKEQRMPSAHTGVDSNAELAKFLNPTSGTNDADTLSAGSGVIHVYAYNGNGYPTETKVKQGSGGTAYFVSATDWGDGTDDKPARLMTASYAYPMQTTTKADGHKTELAYTFHDAGDTQLQTTTTTYPAVDAAQNGSGVAVTSSAYYDTRGRLRWSKDGEGRIAYLSYHPDTGSVAYGMTDVKTNSLPTDITSGSAGKWVAWTENGGAAPAGFTYTGADAVQLVSTVEYDEQGRASKTVEACGSVTYIVHKDNETRTYPAYDAATDKPLLPVQVVKADDHGQTTEQFTVDPSGVTFADPPTGAETLPQSAYVTWTRQGYDDHDQHQTVDAYHDIPSSGTGTLSTHFHRTFYKYDSRGRRTHTIEVVSGTSTSAAVEQVTKQVYDVLDRVIETHLGVSDAAHDMGSGYGTDPTLKKVAAIFYDESSPGSGTAAVGDGKVTSTVSYYDAANTSNNTTTVFHYNWRNELRGIAPEAAPYTVQDVDWMGRVVARAQFTAEPTWSTVAGDADYAETVTTNRRTLSTTKQDKMNRVYRASVYAVNSSGTAGSAILTDTFYDRRSLVVATASSGSGGTEIAYDGAGRIYQSRVVTELESTRYSSGAYNYRDPQPKRVLADMTGGNDKVIELSHQVLDASGLAEQSITLGLNHDDSDGLDIAAATKDYVQTAAYSWYDGADRLVATASYGTNDSAWKYAALAARPSSPPASSDTVLVSGYGYNSQGRLESFTDPKGIVTRTFYDDLGRTRYVAENYHNFNASDETLSGNGSDKSKDRVTKYVYNGLSEVTEQIALDANADGNLSDNQTTRYLYEDAYHASLVTSTIYPDSGDSTSSGFDQVKIAYNLDGTPGTRTAQKGAGGDTATVITYGYDDAFRRDTLQGVTTVGTGVDGAVRSIKKEYDSLGRLEKVTSYASSDGTGTAANQVQYEYDDLQAGAKEYQEHAGAVNTGTSLKVQYGYDTTAASSVFTKGYRRKSMTYPDGRVVHQLYSDAGDTSGIGDGLSRVSAIASAATRGVGDANVLAAYAYSGSGTMVQKDLPQPDVRLDYFGGTSGTYAGFDRFGRVIDHRWHDYGASADRERVKHGYDRNANRTWRENTVAASGHDHLYGHDNLNRLKSASRGDLNGTYDAIATLAFAQAWGLDALGNWQDFQEDADGNGSFAGAGDLDQERTHNAANEITGISEGIGQIAWVDPAQDAMGNITSYPKPSSPASSYSAKYDGWNRLVEVRDGVNLVGAYGYDGLGRRVTKKTYASGVLDETRHYYYSNEWQVLEERVDERTNDLERQYVWGEGYVDELVLRDRDTGDDGTLEERLYALQDANYNVTCLVDTGGAAVERYSYTAYGVRTIHDGSFGSRASSSYGWDIGHQGLMHDAESGLVYNRHRQFSPMLGRFLSRDPWLYVDALGMAWMNDLSQLLHHLLRQSHSGHPDGPHSYQYVRGRPTTLVDPTGLATVQACYNKYVMSLLGTGSAKEFMDKAKECIAEGVSFVGGSMDAFANCVASKANGAAKTAALKFACCMSNQFAFNVEEAQANIRNCQSRCDWQRCQDQVELLKATPAAMIPFQKQHDLCQTQCLCNPT